MQLLFFKQGLTFWGHFKLDAEEGFQLITGALLLGSFGYYTIEQFQALAYAKGVSNVSDLISLTFNSQKVTVVCDFADMGSAGKQHYLTTHGGSASIEESNRVDRR